MVHLNAKLNSRENIFSHDGIIKMLSAKHSQNHDKFITNSVSHQNLYSNNFFFKKKNILLTFTLHYP